jgi:hypothetical protein
MKIAFGFKAHSGWAALVAAGWRNGDAMILDRRRIELVEEAWAKQPYHAAEDLPPDAAEALVRRGVQAARRIALWEMRAAVAREQKRQNDVTACGVLVNNPMPGWSTGEILAVHFRMHKAEGVLFRDALVRAAGGCRLRVAEIPEKQLLQEAERALGKPAKELANTLAALGRSAGPPWGKDQKDAALAALIALRAQSKSR